MCLVYNEEQFKGLLILVVTVRIIAIIGTLLVAIGFWRVLTSTNHSSVRIIAIMRTLVTDQYTDGFIYKLLVIL